MITKEELLHYLKENLHIEEKALPIYSQHLNNTVFLSAFSREDQEKIKQIMQVLKSESEGHKKVYEGLIQRVKESENNVF